MKEKERTTITALVAKIRQLDSAQREKLFWISQGMILDREGANGNKENS